MVEGSPDGQYEDSYDKTARLRGEAAAVLRELRQAVEMRDKDIDAAQEGRSNILSMEGILEALDKEMNAMRDSVASLKLKYKAEFDKGADAVGEVLDGYMADIMDLQDRILTTEERSISLCGQMQTLYEEHAALSGDADGSVAVVGMLFRKYVDICKQLRDLK